MKTTTLALLATILAAPLAAQTTAPAAGVTVPSALRQSFGAASFSWPLAMRPNRFQQVIRGAELPPSLEIGALCFRKDDRIYSYGGRTVDLEIRLGTTRLDERTIGPEFARNFDAEPARVVLPRRQLRLPDMPWEPPATPDEFFLRIDLERSFVFDRALGRNLLLEIAVYGNDVNNQDWLYPLDSAIGTTSTMVYGNGATATTGVVSATHGLALRFLAKHDRKAGWSAMFARSAPPSMLAPELFGGREPLLGRTAVAQVYAKGWDAALFVLMTGARPQQRQAMPGYDLFYHFDPAAIFAVLPVPVQGDAATLSLPLPQAPQLAGLDLGIQALSVVARSYSLIGASNLLVGNLGTSLFGSLTMMSFSVLVHPYKMNDASTQLLIHTAGETADKAQLQISKAVGGPIDVVVGDKVVDTIGIDQLTYSKTIDVPAGQPVYLRNLGASSVSVTYEITVVD